MILSRTVGPLESPRLLMSYFPILVQISVQTFQSTLSVDEYL